MDQINFISSMFALFSISLLTACQTVSDSSLLSGPTRTVILCEQKNAASSLRLIAIARSEHPEILDVRYRFIAESGISSNEQSAEMLLSDSDGTSSLIFSSKNEDSPLKKINVNTATSTIVMNSETETTIDCNLHQVSERDPSQRKATCSGIGTPAQGWYVAGKLIQHDQKCHVSDMRCSFPQSQSERWVIYNKPFPNDINLEKCADSKACKVSNDFFELVSVNKIPGAKCGRTLKSQVASSK